MKRVLVSEYSRDVADFHKRNMVESPGAREDLERDYRKPWGQIQIDVYRVIKENGPIGAADANRILDYGVSTVNSTFQALYKRGLVTRENGKYEVAK